MYKVTILWKNYSNITIKIFKRRNTAIHYLGFKLNRKFSEIAEWKFEELKNAEA